MDGVVGKGKGGVNCEEVKLRRKMHKGRVKFIFFFKQKTAYEIKECDWSSDVCSSDLPSNKLSIYNLSELIKKNKILKLILRVFE